MILHQQFDLKKVFKGLILLLLILITQYYFRQQIVLLYYWCWMKYLNDFDSLRSRFRFISQTFDHKIFQLIKEIRFNMWGNIYDFNSCCFKRSRIHYNNSVLQSSVSLYWPFIIIVIIWNMKIIPDLLPCLWIFPLKLSVSCRCYQYMHHKSEGIYA